MQLEHATAQSMVLQKNIITVHGFLGNFSHAQGVKSIACAMLRQSAHAIHFNTFHLYSFNSRLSKMIAHLNVSFLSAD